MWTRGAAGLRVVALCLRSNSTKKQRQSIALLLRTLPSLSCCLSGQPLLFSLCVQVSLHPLHSSLNGGLRRKPHSNNRKRNKGNRSHHREAWTRASSSSFITPTMLRAAQLAQLPRTHTAAASASLRCSQPQLQRRHCAPLQLACPSEATRALHTLARSVARAPSTSLRCGPLLSSACAAAASAASAAPPSCSSQLLLVSRRGAVSGTGPRPRRPDGSESSDSVPLERQTRAEHLTAVLQGKNRVLMATPFMKLGWAVALAVAAYLGVQYYKIRFLHPVQHDLVTQACIMAERDPRLMRSINDQSAAAAAAATAAAATTTASAEQGDASSSPSSAAAVAPLLSGPAAPAGKSSRKLTARELDPLMLRTGRMYDSLASFDPTLLAPTLSSIDPVQPASSSSSGDDEVLARAGVPAGSVQALKDAAGLNRMELYLELPDTNFGPGQLHILGRKTPRIIVAKIAPEQPKTPDGRFIVATTKPEPLPSATAIASAAATAASDAALTTWQALQDASFATSAGSQMLLDWELVSMSLVFPQAQPQPLSFDLKPNALAFERNEGPQKATPPHSDPAAPAALAKRLWWALVPWELSGASVLKVGGWGLAALLGAVWVMRNPSFRATDHALNHAAMNALRDHPTVRGALKLDEVPLGERHTRGILIEQKAAYWASPTMGLIPVRQQYTQVIKDRSKIRLEYDIRGSHSVNSKPARVVIQASRIPMQALFGRLQWRKWKIDNATISVGHTSVKIKDFKV